MSIKEKSTDWIQPTFYLCLIKSYQVCTKNKKVLKLRERKIDHMSYWGNRPRRVTGSNRLPFFSQISNLLKL